MPLPEPHIDLTTLDLTKVIAGPDEIRKYLPHRHEFEMLSGINYVDREKHIIIGFKDARPDEFWVRGHFPSLPIMPGVLMCEAAAQISAYYTLSVGITTTKYMGLGGIDNSRFRRAVRPGERLTLVAKGLRVRPRMTNFNIQGFVGLELAFETDITGVTLAKIAE